MSKKTYLFREYLIAEYEIEANTREEAEELIYSDKCVQQAEWTDRFTLRVKPPGYYSPYEGQK